MYWQLKYSYLEKLDKCLINKFLMIQRQREQIHLHCATVHLQPIHKVQGYSQIFQPLWPAYRKIFVSGAANMRRGERLKSEQ